MTAMQPTSTPPESTDISTVIQLGLDTFGDVAVDDDGRLLPQHQVIRDIVEQGVLADRVGVEHFGVGEHHRDDFAVSAPDVVLAAVAARTSAIRLGSAVTVLSSDDPVRVFERFATLDAVSGGRAEVIVGRGSFTESFPLFGLDLSDYDHLFEERLDLLARLREEQPVTWSGATSRGLRDQRVFPTTASGRLPVWVGVGGSPDSVVRAARHGLPMALAVIGGDPARFRPFVDLYHRATRELGTGDHPVGVHSGGFVAETDAEARETFYPHYKSGIDRIGAERGWPPMDRGRFEAELEHGSLYVGSPATVAARIARTVSVLGVDRFHLKYANGPVPHRQLMRGIELFGTEVAPRVPSSSPHLPGPSPWPVDRPALHDDQHSMTTGTTIDGVRRGSATPSAGTSGWSPHGTTRSPWAAPPPPDFDPAGDARTVLLPTNRPALGSSARPTSS